MSQTTTYTCDRCRAQKVDEPQFLTVVTVRVGAGWSRDGYTNAVIPAQMWCNECIVQMGLLHPGTLSMDSSKAPATPPTLEEVIREIVREEIQAAQT
jgi:hypothetical protein